MTVYYNYNGKALHTSPKPTSTAGLSGGVEAHGDLYATQSRTEMWGGDGVEMHGLGGDSLHVVSQKDRIFESPKDGVNTVYAWQSIYLPKYANVQNLTVYGTNNAYGSSLDGILSGSGSGMQQFFANGGNDVLIGGDGPDVFIIIKGDGNEVIQNFDPSKGDAVRLTAGFTSFSQVKAHLTQHGNDVLLKFDGGDGMIFRNLTIDQLSPSNFELQLDKSKLGPMTFSEDFSHRLRLYDPQYAQRGVWQPDFGGDPQSQHDYNINGELEAYVSPYFRGADGSFPIIPFSSSEGVLSIQAQRSNNPNLFGLNYTSGLITTAHSFSQTYGYYEIKAKPPQTAGAWSAFWLMPENGGWPPEADIMEDWGSARDASLTAWHSGPNDTSSTENQLVPRTADGFHRYGLLWTPKNLIWYIDGVEVWRQATPSDMHQPMYMLANLALTNKDGPVHAPTSLKIDYVHVYSIPGVSVAGPGDAKSLRTAAKWTFAPAYVTTVTLTGSIRQNVIANGNGDTLISNSAGSNLVGGAGDDTLVAGSGGDTLDGRGGDDTFVFQRQTAQPAVIKGFDVGHDRLDLRVLLKHSGYAGATPGTDGYVSLAPDGAGGAELIFHPDGRGGGASVELADLLGISPTLNPDRLFSAGNLEAASPKSPTAETAPAPSATMQSGRIGSMLAYAAAGFSASPDPGATSADSRTLDPHPWSATLVTLAGRR